MIGMTRPKAKDRPRGKPFDEPERKYLCSLDIIDACTEKRITWNKTFIEYAEKELEAGSRPVDIFRGGSRTGTHRTETHRTMRGAMAGQDQERGTAMSVRNDDNIIKSLVILAVCIVAMLMVCTECALLPQYGWLWLILLLILAIAAVFSVVMGIKTWLDEHGRK